MRYRLERVSDTEGLKATLEADMLANAHFLSRVFRPGDSYDVYASQDLKAVMAVQDSQEHMVFAGDWESVDIPPESIPNRRFFVSASPPAAVERLKRLRETTGEWPCWYFLAPESYGPGEWDGLGPLEEGDVKFIAPFWELGGDDREEHIRHSVRECDSACLRIGEKPVSWCGLHFCLGGIGNLGFAHTLAEHRRRGYQALVTKSIVNKLHLRGWRATADVIKDNAASIATCKSLGFTVAGEQSWADFKAQ